MALFTQQDITTVGEMFRRIPLNNRDLVTGIMIGQNISQDPTTLPEMMNLAMSLAKEGKLA